MPRTWIGWGLVGVQVVLFVGLLLLPWRAPGLIGLTVGAVLVVAGAALAMTAFRGLGRALTPTPVPIRGAGLRTSGAYRFVRHPIYSAILLITLGLLVAIGSGWSWAWGLLMLMFFWAKSRWEDALLHEEYGRAWEQWAERTGALVPRPGAWRAS